MTSESIIMLHLISYTKQDELASQFNYHELKNTATILNLDVTVLFEIVSNSIF